MAYPKFKSETYNCTGGINQKISLYLAREGEFLQIQNFDLGTVGALSRFPGFTQYSNPLSSPNGRISGIAAYNTPVFATTSFVNSATFALLIGTYNYLYQCTGTTFATLAAGLIDVPNTFRGQQFTWATGGSGIYGTNGYNFFSYFGSTVGWNFGVPKPTFGTSNAVGFTATGGVGAGVSGTLVMYFSIVRDDGFYGPALAYTATVAGATAYQFNVPYVPIVYAAGSPTPNGFSGIRAWAALNGGIARGYTGLFPLGTTTLPQGITIGFDFTAAGWNLQTPQPRDFQSTFYWGLGSTQGSDDTVPTLPRNPALVESFAGSLFTTAFAERGNRVLFSEPGAPEDADYENFIDVGDASTITAWKSYLSQLVIFKYSEIWSLSGTGADDFTLSQVNPKYGCIARNAACVWDQRLWFLDATGIYEYNGANVTAVAEKLDAVFRDMNIAQAKQFAVMFHMKPRKEVWCFVTTNTMGNIFLVYNNDANGWSIRTTELSASAALNMVASLRLGNTTEQVFLSQSIASPLYVMGASFYSDNGSGYTCVMKSRFIEGDMGNSVTKMWRRLYVDAAIPAGATFPVIANFYADKGSSVVYSTTMMLSSFQTRIDFGIPAKALAVELIYSAGASFLQIPGFTVEYRFQRAT